MKQAVYFYRENDYSVAIGLGKSNDDVGRLLALTKEEMEHFNTEHPQSKDNLYALVDGVVFKIKHAVVEK